MFPEWSKCLFHSGETWTGYVGWFPGHAAALPLEPYRENHKHQFMRALFPSECITAR